MDLDSAKKAVLNCQKAGGNWNDLAEYMGEAKSGLHNYGNANRPDADPRNKPLSWWLSLQSFAGQPIVTQAMAEHDDLVCMPQDRSEKCLDDATIEFAAAAGGLLAANQEARADGVIDSAEDRDLDGHIANTTAKLLDYSRAKNEARRRSNA